MDRVLSFLISVGIIAFGVWVVAGTIAAGWPLAALMGLIVDTRAAATQAKSRADATASSSGADSRHATQRLRTIIGLAMDEDHGSRILVHQLETPVAAEKNAVLRASLRPLVFSGWTGSSGAGWGPAARSSTATGPL